MKRVSKFLVAVAAVALFAMGCASAGGRQDASSSTSAQNASAPVVESKGSGVPEWYENPSEGFEDPYVYGVGSAKMSTSDRSRKAAEHRARNSLTFQLETLVDAMETDYGAEGGTTNDEAVTQMFEEIDRQLASAVLRGAKITKRKIADDGTVYALAALPEESAKNMTKGVIENAASKNARIKRDVALGAMDAAFAVKSNPKPIESD